MSSDLRLLASDISGNRFITLPGRQAGSSIMPGKVNPVIAEYVISAAHRVCANDVLISSLCSQGTLELNAYLPVTGCAIIESIKLLSGCNSALRRFMLAGIGVNAGPGYNALMHSPSVTTALSPHIGYNKASEVAALMKDKGLDIFEANKILGVLSGEKLQSILEPGNLLKLGFSIDDLA
jgi:aspartate ammonia-lyase